MTVDEVKQLLKSAGAIERECERMRNEIEQRREELIGVKSTMRGIDKVMSSDTLSMPERVYFRLEELYNQYGDILQKQFDKRNEIEAAIGKLDAVEQEIVRAMIAGKTEEQIGKSVGYSRPTIARYKKKILIKLSKSPNIRKVDTP